MKSIGIAVDGTSWYSPFDVMAIAKLHLGYLAILRAYLTTDVDASFPFDVIEWHEIEILAVLLSADDISN